MPALALVHDKHRKPNGPEPSSFVVESGIPMPSKRTGYETYPFDRMNVGDSFAIRSETMRKRASSACVAYAKKNPDTKFGIRRVGDGGWRCWRVK